MRRVRLWPSGLTGRVTLVLLAAILVEFLGSVLVFGEAERLLMRNEQSQRIAEQLVVAERVIQTAAPATRVQTATALSTRHVRFDWSRQPPGIDRKSAKTAAIVSEILLWEPTLARHALRLGTRDKGGESYLIGGVRLDDGTWLQFKSNEPLTPWATAIETLLSVAIVALAVVLVAAVLVRTLAAPLRALAAAAGEIGFEHRVHVEGAGPRELSQLAEALNAMQDRIGQLIDTRTQALTAVSHDLRTPLSRLKMRIGAPAAALDADAMREDVDEMEAMLTSILDFMRGGELEAPRRIDVASLLQTIADDAADMGHDVSYAGPAGLNAMARPVLLRRAITNLVDNAVHYGGSATIGLEAGRGAGGRAGLNIIVRDRGPGIDAGEIARVTEPFMRGDHARARDTKGLGLGLAVADQAARVHGGTLTLENADPGLRATLFLPDHA
ncbi:MULTISPECIES: sensor histidine kinase [unclassified Sphingomonas]|uniref:sensor histidine kinase n=1 Tax=unclassified Sphingomonas TaxID=196159 RepID=UPI000836391C|nr:MULTISPECIES: HAMP domain-containing sensor histidine kinase [unclassified Sphingomonas]